MAVYKQFNSQDIIVSPLMVHKQFTFKWEEYSNSDVGITEMIGNSTLIFNNLLTSQHYSRTAISNALNYNIIKHLYYSNYINGVEGDISIATTASFNTDGTIEGPYRQNNFYNFNSTTLNPQKYFPFSEDKSIGILSIPQSLYGDYIKPKSFSLSLPQKKTVLLLNTDVLTSDNDILTLHIDGEEEITEPPITDNGNGVLLRDGEKVGNIIYEHGIIILFDITNTQLNIDYDTSVSQYVTGINPNSVFNYINNINSEISFESSHTIYETQYKCTITPEEFNYSNNPTLFSGSQGDIHSQYTGSYFNPYITTIGIYNQNHELLMVGKLSEPLPTSRTTDTTILIKIDK